MARCVTNLEKATLLSLPVLALLCHLEDLWDWVRIPLVLMLAFLCQKSIRNDTCKASCSSFINKNSKQFLSVTVSGKVYTFFDTDLLTENNKSSFPTCAFTNNSHSNNNKHTLSMHQTF